MLVKEAKRQSRQNPSISVHKMSLPACMRTITESCHVTSLTIRKGVARDGRDERSVILRSLSSDCQLSMGESLFTIFVSLA